MLCVKMLFSMLMLTNKLLHMFIDLFFQLEREYILQTPSDSDAETPQAAAKPDARRIGKDIDEDMPSRYQLIHLNDEWYMSASGKRSSKNQPKRKHRKTHGKIGFLELSSVISKRWHNLQELDAETKSYVAKVAARLLEEYKRDMAAFKAQNMTMSAPTPTMSMFPALATSSFVPNMSYLAQPSGEFNYPMANYASLPARPALPLQTSEAKKPSPSTFDVDFDQLLQDDFISFKTEHRKPEPEPEVKVKEVDPFSGFTFHPVSRKDYMKMKRKSSNGDDRHSKRRRSIEAIEAEKDALKMKILALQDELRIERERTAPSPTLDDIFFDIGKMNRNAPSPTLDDICGAPCPISPSASAEGSDVDADDLMLVFQGSELFA